MAFKKPSLDKAHPGVGDLVIYPIGDAIPAWVGFGDVTYVRGSTFVVQPTSSKEGVIPEKQLMNRGEARVVLSAADRLRI